MTTSPGNFEAYCFKTKTTVYFGSREQSARAAARRVGGIFYPDSEKPSGKPLACSAADKSTAPTAIKNAARRAAFGVKYTNENARSAGYTGDVCGNCGSLRVRRNGTCTLCAECGTTSGCS